MVVEGCGSFDRLCELVEKSRVGGALICDGPSFALRASTPPSACGAPACRPSPGWNPADDRMRPSRAASSGIGISKRVAEILDQLFSFSFFCWWVVIAAFSGFAQAVAFYGLGEDHRRLRLCAPRRA